jgi:hypothetical protein
MTTAKDVRPHFGAGETGAEKRGVSLDVFICLLRVPQSALNGVAIKYRYFRNIYLLFYKLVKSQKWLFYFIVFSRTSQ